MLILLVLRADTPGDLCPSQQWKVCSKDACPRWVCLAKHSNHPDHTAHAKVSQTISSDWSEGLSGQSCPSSQARTFHCSHATWQIHSLSRSIVLCHYSHRSVDAFEKGKQCFWAEEPKSEWQEAWSTPKKSGYRGRMPLWVGRRSL